MILKTFRKSLIILFTFTIVFFLNQTKSFSQNKKVIRSVDEAISLALKNNSDVIKAYLDKLQADQKVSEVYSENLVPTITLNSKYTRVFKKQVFDIFGQKIPIGSDNSLSNTFDVNESLPILGTPIFSGIRIAEYYSGVQKENIFKVENDVKTDVKKAYYTVLLAKAVLEANKLTLQNAEENFIVVDAKYRNGVTTEFDFLRAKVKVDNAKPDLSKSERNLEISQRALLNSIGLKTNDQLEVSGDLTYDSTEVWENTNYMINKISEDYVLVRQLLINKKINEELVRVDKANYLPKLFLFGQYVLSAQENDGRTINNYRFYNTSNAGLGLTWNLNFFRNNYKVNQSEIEVKKTDEQISDTKQKLKLLSQSAVIAIEDAKERILSQKETLALAERGRDLANISYRAGALNQIDVQDAELTLTQSRLGYLQAIYDYQIAKAELERLLEK